MIAKKVVIVAKPFKDREGKDRKPGDRMEVDPDYGVELEREGNAKPEQLPADQGKHPGAHPDNTLPTPPKAEPK
jgi:hypothetical protein